MDGPVSGIIRLCLSYLFPAFTVCSGPRIGRDSMQDNAENDSAGDSAGKRVVNEKITG